VKSLGIRSVADNLGWAALVTLAFLPVASWIAALPVCLTGEALVLFALMLVLGVIAGLAVIAAASSRFWLAMLPATVFALGTLRFLRDTQQLGLPRLQLIALSIALAPLLALGGRFLAGRVSPRRWVLLALMSGSIALAISLVAYRSSNYLRWVLLRHLPTIGVPLHRLLDADVTTEAKRSRGEAASSPPPVSALAPVKAPAPPAAPDLVFVLVDTLRADALAPWGGPAGELPEFERLARDGAVFLDAQANTSWTRPSVGTFFTGLLPEEHGAMDFPDGLGDWNQTLAESLRQRGYQTAAFIANPAVIGRKIGFAQGFDHFEELAAKPYPRAEAIRAAVERWVTTRDSARPYFLFVHFFDPHTPYLAGVKPQSQRPADQLAPYRAELRYLDGQLARLRSTLEAHSGRPVAWFLTSDHGEELGDHGGLFHGHALYRELVQIPAFLVAPGVRSSAISARLEARDFFDLLSALPDGAVDIAAWAAKRQRSLRYASVFWTDREPGNIDARRAVASRRIDTESETLIWSSYGDTYELYDRRTDPREKFNLASRRPERLAALREMLATATPPLGFSLPLDLSGEERGRLRALGYLR